MQGLVETARGELEAGNHAQCLILAFNAASEAAERGDVHELEQAIALARTVASSEEALREEAERLVGLWQPRLESLRTRSEDQGESQMHHAGMIDCPDCGREIPEDAVRCRFCGHLMV
jgi:hypothetical protein